MTSCWRIVYIYICIYIYIYIYALYAYIFIIFGMKILLQITSESYKSHSVLCEKLEQALEKDLANFAKKTHYRCLAGS